MCYILFKDVFFFKIVKFKLVFKSFLVVIRLDDLVFMIIVCFVFIIIVKVFLNFGLRVI